MLKKIGKLIAVVFLLLIVAGLFLSHEFEVEESILLNAAPADIHPYVNDLKQWPKWTPWKELEPDVIVRYGNVTHGVGASQSWRGSGGNGHLHITASSPDNGIAYDIFFDEDTTPSISAIEYKPLGNGVTRVSWRIHGEIEVPVVGGYVALFVRYFTGSIYQKGLLKLKAVVENDNSPK